jgi:hypothetical protein
MTVLKKASWPRQIRVYPWQIKFFCRLLAGCVLFFLVVVLLLLLLVARGTGILRVELPAGCLPTTVLPLLLRLVLILLLLVLLLLLRLILLLLPEQFEQSFEVANHPLLHRPAGQ